MDLCCHCAESIQPSECRRFVLLLEPGTDNALSEERIDVLIWHMCFMSTVRKEENCALHLFDIAVGSAKRKYRFLFQPRAKAVSGVSCRLGLQVVLHSAA